MMKQEDIDSLDPFLKDLAESLLAHQDEPIKFIAALSGIFAGIGLMPGPLEKIAALGRLCEAACDQLLERHGAESMTSFSYEKEDA